MSDTVWSYRDNESGAGPRPGGLRRRGRGRLASARSTRPAPRPSGAWLVVDTGFWIFGKKRLIPAGTVAGDGPRGQADHRQRERRTRSRPRPTTTTTPGTSRRAASTPSTTRSAPGTRTARTSPATTGRPVRAPARWTGADGSRTHPSAGWRRRLPADDPGLGGAVGAVDHRAEPGSLIVQSSTPAVLDHPSGGELAGHLPMGVAGRSTGWLRRGFETPNTWEGTMSDTLWSYRDTTWSQDRDLVGYSVKASDGPSARSTRPATRPAASGWSSTRAPWIFGKKRLIPAGCVDRGGSRLRDRPGHHDEGPDQGRARLREERLERRLPGSPHRLLPALQRAA